MRYVSTILLMGEESAVKAIEIAAENGVELQPVVINNISQLKQIDDINPELILSYGTSVIVPEKYLLSEGVLAINIHAASPEFPGRDPHHFAVFKEVRRYGATMHFMTADVDAGDIIDVEWFDVPDKPEPLELLSLASDKAWKLIEKLFYILGEGEKPSKSKTLVWSGEKNSRKKFEELCKVDLPISNYDLELKKRAVSMPGYENLYVELHGYKFFLKGSD